MPPEAHSPVFKLPSEILLRIFAFNAAMNPSTDNKKPALDNLRALSHVCTRWRMLLLGSPSIWSQSLNLKHLQNLSPKWRDEIVRRAGEADMDVMAKSAGEPFASDFICKHWERIRTLDVTGPGYLRLSQYEVWSNIAQKPSNQLLHLTIFCGRRTVADFLVSISLTNFPRLQSLEIIEERGFRDPDVAKKISFNPASLPWLRFIYLPSVSSPMMDHVLHCLDSINPAKDCVLRLTGDVSFRNSPPSTVNKMSSVLQKYSKLAETAAQVHSWSNPDSARRAIISFLQNYVEMYIQIAPSSFGKVSAFDFSLRDSDHPRPQFESQIYQHIIPALYPFSSAIENLELELELPQFYSDALNSALGHLLSTFTSVKDLLVDDKALQYLGELQSRPSFSSTLIFPFLQTIRTFTRPNLPSFKRYLESRKAMGATIESCTLVIPWISGEETADLSALDGLTGLNVRMRKTMPDVKSGEMHVVIQ